MVLGFRYSHHLHRGSVLPRIAVTRTPDGMQLLATRPGWKDVAVLIIFLSFLTLFLWFLISDPIRNRRQADAVSGILFAAGMLSEYGRRYLRQRRLEYARLVVRPWPIRLGQTVTTKFRSKPLTLVSAKLVCVEEARVSRGKYETVKHATRLELALDASTDRWTFDIPREGLPSLAVASNKVQWMVKTMLEGECVADFELLVVPQVAK